MWCIMCTFTVTPIIFAVPDSIATIPGSNSIEDSFTSVPHVSNCINNNGIVVGGYEDVSTNFHGFIRAVNGSFTLFDVPSTGDFAGSINTVGIAINDSDIIVGEWQTTIEPNNGVIRGFIRDALGNFTDFARFTYPTHTPLDMNIVGINSSGLISGSWVGGGGYGGAFVYDGVTFTDILPDNVNIAGANICPINDFNIVAGSYTDTSAVYHAFFGPIGGPYTYFDDVGTDTFQPYLNAINNSGTIVGTYRIGGDTNGFIRKSDGTFILINFFGGNYLYSINNSNVVFGVDSFGSGLIYPIGSETCDDTQYTFTIPTTSSLTSLWINNNGEMVGTCNVDIINGFVATYTLVPPSSSLVLSCALETGYLNEPYSSYLITTGGIPPYTFSIISGELPPGLSLDFSTGLISGTPVRPGNYPYTAEVVDSDSPQSIATTSCRIVINVFPPPPCYLVDFPVNGPFYGPTGQLLRNGYLLIRLVFDCNCPCADYQITGNNRVKVPLDINGNVPVSPPVQIRPNDQLKPDGSYYILQAFSEAGQLCLGSKVLKILSS